jgi:hypothetical protein
MNRSAGTAQGCLVFEPVFGAQSWLVDRPGSLSNPFEFEGNRLLVQPFTVTAHMVEKQHTPAFS